MTAPQTDILLRVMDAFRDEDAASDGRAGWQDLAAAALREVADWLDDYDQDFIEFDVPELLRQYAAGTNPLVTSKGSSGRSTERAQMLADIDAADDDD